MRDPERQNIFGNTFSVQFPDFPSMSRLPRYITIHQEMGKHDIVELYYQNVSPLIVEGLKTGTPIKITWSNDKVSKDWFGYTSHSTPKVAQQLERYVKLTCVGSSYPLKETAHKIWINKTASEIVEEVAKNFKLKPLVTQSQVRFGQLSMAGHSYWEKLNELAHRIGFAFHVHGTELHFHPIDKMIDQFMTTIPVMAFLDPLTNPQSHFSAQTLAHFEPMVGDYFDDAYHTRSSKIVGGVDPLTGKPYTYTSSPNSVGKKVRTNTKDPLFNKVETGVVTTSTTMTKEFADAKAQLSRLSMPARGSGQGDPRIAPWNTLEVRGSGDLTDGFWVVKSATHTVHYDGRYHVDFVVATDGIGTNAPSATRPTKAGKVPVVNVQAILSKPSSKPTSTKLTATTTMITQKQSGFKTTPRRWRGN